MNSDGRMTMQFFHRTSNRNWINSSTVEDFTDPLPYSSIFFPPSTSDHSTSPIKTTSTASDLSILRLEHQDLISRHKSCLSQLQKTFREAETLRQENTNLRVANGDLGNQLSHLVDGYLPNQFDPMIMSCGSSSSISTEIVTPPPQPSVTEQFSGLRVGEKTTDFTRRETGKSPTSVFESDRSERDVDHVTLPKSISVRSTGFLKFADQVAPKGTASSTSGGSSRNRHSVPVDAPVTTDILKLQQKVYVRGGNKKDGPIELEVHTQGMFKTELCNKWEEAGTCPYGEHCQFAHGLEELRPVLRHPRYKTEVCRMVLAGDPCPYGHRCHFRHALTEQEKLMLPFKLD